MRLFVTGATGFIGSHFVQRAIAAGHDVVALRRSSESQPRIQLNEEPRWLNKSLDAVVAGDLQGVDALVHLASAGVSPQRATWQTMFRVNVSESLSLWQMAAHAGATRLIVCGSCNEYGAAAQRCEFLTAESPLAPTGGYGASKAAASMAAIGLAAEQKLEVVIARPFHVYGKGQHADNFWPSLHRAAIGGENFDMTLGEQVRDFVPVEQVADALLDCCTRRDVTPGQARIVNIGSGRPQSLRQFAEHWWAHWNALGSLRIGVIPYRDGEIMRYAPALAGAPSE